MILTGFACAYVAISMVKTPASQGYAFFVEMVIAKFGPAWGLGVGVYTMLLLKKVPFTSSPNDLTAAEEEANS